MTAKPEIAEPSMSNPPSRRDFIVRTTIGALGLAAARRAYASETAQPSDWTPMIVGTYTEKGISAGIYATALNHRTGELAPATGKGVGDNPSFLALHPNGRHLYAVNEVLTVGDESTGAVAAFDLARWDSAGATLPVHGARRLTGGGAPCYVSLDHELRFALVANYVGGNVTVLPVEADGSLGAPTHIVQHSGRGPNAARQEAAHAHCVIADPTNRFALVADLGVDRVMVYRLGGDGRLSRMVGADAAMKPGAGPRHLVFHPAIALLYVANELDSTVTTLRFDADTGRLTTIGSVSTLPEGFTGQSFVADIHVSPRGDSLYVSNRGHDSIAGFAIAPGTGELTRTQLISTEGSWPRNFGVHPSGEWLVVANERSDSLVVLARDMRTGQLAPTGRRLPVPSPVCVLFRGAAA